MCRSAANGRQSQESHLCNSANFVALSYSCLSAFMLMWARVCEQPRRCHAVVSCCGATHATPSSPVAPILANVGAGATFAIPAFGLLERSWRAAHNQGAYNVLF